MVGCRLTHAYILTPTTMAFEGFQSGNTECPSGAVVFSYRRFDSTAAAKSRPLLVLLHGYPQNSLMWKDFVNEIPDEWEVLIPDLPGYGNSTKPVNPATHSLGHSKREWAKDIVHVIDTLWGQDTQFIAYGHDRGARLAYRLALDYPTRVAGAALLDIVPTSYVWDAMRLEKGHEETKRTHHWVFLSSPRPLPETMIASNPQFYFDYTIRGWTGRTMRDTDAAWISESIAPYLDKERGKDRIAAACEDYRAGANHDIHDDFTSSINPLSHHIPTSTNPAPAPHPPPFKCPLLILSSHHLRARFDVDAIWFSLGEPGKVQSFQIGNDDTGHFIVNEETEETGKKTTEWLDTFWPLPEA
ncbi:alpha/beta-hydrolase [Rickenella mellea]|uniref:Alpha/beta-hydrolase n=1 Tax=Rickenella mellea TaxID=50990 RepID=A0A4Y7QC44_9AGAM|nr:alpha/beta-hydrolase [Rickenella mellea]